MAAETGFTKGEKTKRLPGIFRFADFELDRNVYDLRRNRHPQKLERIPLDLLFLLIEKRGQLVTREEILERLCGKGVFFDVDNAINSAVRKLRRSLADDPEVPRFVVTVPTKGYRFVAELDDLSLVRWEADLSVSPEIVGNVARPIGCQILTGQRSRRAIVDASGEWSKTSADLASSVGATVPLR